MENKSIVIKELCKKHKDKLVLNKVSFEAKQGRITAFLGENGAGKSSTLRILLGLDYATSGSATFGNEEYVNFNLPLKTVGAVFDGLGGVPSRKVKTHLSIHAKSNRIQISRIDEVLEIVKMSEKKQSTLGSLSLGEGQRINIACALLGNPQYLVLDEPTNGLDPNGIRWLRDFVRKQAREGKTVLLSSHYLSEVEEVADDIVVIHNGEIKANGDIHLIKESKGSLEELFFSFSKGDNEHA